MRSAKGSVIELLNKADVTINGSNPWDIVVHNDALYERWLSQGSIGVGESYMDAWWDCQALDQFFDRIYRAHLEDAVRSFPPLLLQNLLAALINRSKKSKAFEIGQKHYDIGNKLYELMLGKSMTYTCGYWKKAKNLDDAQTAKLDLVCKKIGLKNGDRVLDIGCGWGGFMKYAAEHYGARCVGITVSTEQVERGRNLTNGLDVEFRLQDYRDIPEENEFDHVVSLGMFEHVGYKNYAQFMNIVKRTLKPTGLFLLQTIGGNYSSRGNDPWIEKYIFPNSMLPSVKQISGAIEKIFILEDLHNFSADYDRTLLSWHKNFNTHWKMLKEIYDERFQRMWNFYLLASAATFRTRKNQLWQFVLSPYGVNGRYDSLR